jgi:hypothetical protein
MQIQIRVEEYGGRYVSSSFAMLLLRILGRLTYRLNIGSQVLSHKLGNWSEFATGFS